jgi:hypothetical protein
LIVSVLFGEAVTPFVDGASFLAVPGPQGPEHQRAGFESIDGPYQPILESILTGGSTSGAAAGLVDELRAATGAYAATLGGEVDPDALEAWADAVEAELGPMLAPLGDVVFVDVEG